MEVRSSDNIKLVGSANLVFKDSTQQATAVQAPASSGQVLTATGAGTWAWAAAAGGLTPLTSYTSSPNNSDVYSTNVINGRIDNMGTFPSQTNQTNMFLTTDGSTLGWGTIPVYTSTTTAGVASNAVYAVTHLNAVFGAADARDAALQTKTQYQTASGNQTVFNSAIQAHNALLEHTGHSSITHSRTTTTSGSYLVGQHVYQGINSASASKPYGTFSVYVSDHTSGAEDSELAFQYMNAGSTRTPITARDGQVMFQDNVKLDTSTTLIFADSSVQASAVTTPGAGDVGKVLTAANGSFSWAEAGGSSWTDIDVTSLSTGSSSSPAYNTAYGVLYGNRRGLWFIKDEYFTTRGDDGYNDSHKLMHVHMSLSLIHI